MTDAVNEGEEFDLAALMEDAAGEPDRFIMVRETLAELMHGYAEASTAWAEQGQEGVAQLLLGVASDFHILFHMQDNAIRVRDGEEPNDDPHAEN